MQIQPIRSETEHAAAVSRIAQLMGAKSGTPASDELEVLATLVDAYEAKRFPIDVPDPIAVIRFRMEQNGLTRKDLEPMIGSRARVSEVLTGKRALTLPMIRRLHVGLGIPVDLLIGLHHTPRRKARPTARKAPARASDAAGRAAARRDGR